MKPKTILDGLCATGARGIRYVKENSGVKKVFLLDANPLAVPFIKKNISLNDLKSKSKVVCDDFNDFCFEKRGAFDFVEIDPFGTPAPFIESALGALKTPGILSLTSTDLANLVKKNAPTLRDYGAKPLYNDFSHETSLRILLGFATRKAFEQNLSLAPLVCFYERHYVKIIARVKRGAVKPRLGFVSYCDKCLSRFEGKKSKCVCGNRLLFAGPLWTEDFCDKKILGKMRQLNSKRRYEDAKQIGKMLLLLGGEQGFPPWFYDTHFVADKFGLKADKKMDFIVECLKKKGFRAARTHFSPTAIKTNASCSELRKFI